MSDQLLELFKRIRCADRRFDAWSTSMPESIWHLSTSVAARMGWEAAQAHWRAEFERYQANVAQGIDTMVEVNRLLHAKLKALEAQQENWGVGR